MSFTIKGIVRYVDLGTGFWGIEANDGKKYQPMPMPEQLKFEGHEIECKAKPSDAMTMFMWGDPVTIVSFNTINPKQ